MIWTRVSLHGERDNKGGIIMKTQSTDYGTITGQISDIELSHCHGENTFYKFKLNSRRKSGYSDTIPCIMNANYLEKIDVTKLDITNVKVYGEFRSRNVTKGGKRKLDLYFKVTDILQMNEDSEIFVDDVNSIFLHGTLCKVPQYRLTPMGRHISDMLIAVNFGNPRANSSYIPLIAWGETAKASSKLETGDIINIEGRIQSRPYRKMIGDMYHEMTAYEVSVNKLFIDNGNGGFENIMTGEVQQ